MVCCCTQTHSYVERANEERFGSKEYLSIDETMYSMRHQINFRQYNSNKAAKYGLLYKSLNHACFAFTYQVIPYCGSPEGGTGPCHLSSTEVYVKSLVNAMPRSSVKSRNISMDRLYTSSSMTSQKEELI